MMELGILRIDNLVKLSSRNIWLTIMKEKSFHQIVLELILCWKNDQWYEKKCSHLWYCNIIWAKNVTSRYTLMTPGTIQTGVYEH